MPAISVRDNRELLRKLVSAYCPGDLILTPSKRLASLVVHFYRDSMIRKKKPAWEAPKVLSLASWLKEISLMRDVPYVAPKYFRWQVFREIVSDFPPPVPFKPGLKLARALDMAFSALIRHGVEWSKSKGADGLFEWRNQVFRRFLDSLRSKGMVHREEVAFLARNSTLLHYFPVKRVHLVLLDSPSPSEQALMSYVTGLVKSCQWGIDESCLEKKVTRIAFGSPEEEIKWTLEEVLEASVKHPLHALGIVLMDPDFQAPLIRRYLEELVGAAATGSSGSYNITMGGALTDTGLFKASVLPMRFWLEGEKRSLFISLLLSSYYGLWRGKRDRLSLLDLDLRSKNCHTNIFTLVKELAGGETFSEYLLPDLWFDCFERIRTFEGTCDEWFSILDTFWNSTGFPVVGDEMDEVSTRHYRELRDSLVHGLGDSRLGIEEFYTWLQSAASDIRVSTTGHEKAGIQVLSPLDARGLFFDRLWIVGLTGNSFPRPVREIPLVSPAEAAAIQGCTPVSQWDFARKLFPKLLACAPEPVLTRHTSLEGEMVAPSPFWGGDEIFLEYSSWKTRKGWWAGSELYRQAVRGALSPSRWSLPLNTLDDVPAFNELSVSALETALSCPFKFLLENVLQLAPMEEKFVGIPPLERGILLHTVLEKFVKKVISGGISLDSEEAMNLLVELSEETICGGGASSLRPFDNSTLRRAQGIASSGHRRLRTSQAQGDVFYELELERWVDDRKGLLVKWLELERKRQKEGYRWQRAEIPFSGLRIGDILLKGRIDRIDARDGGTLMCLEYKTGMLPGPKIVFDHMVRPQLPAYRLAVKKGMVGGIESFRDEDRKIDGVAAGYLTLKKPGEVQIREYEPRKESWDHFIERWKKWVILRTKSLLGGKYPADPVPDPVETGSSPCSFCNYSLICNRSFVEDEGANSG